MKYVRTPGFLIDLRRLPEWVHVRFVGTQDHLRGLAWSSGSRLVVTITTDRLLVTGSWPKPLVTTTPPADSTPCCW
jgi:hypothetical protein